MDAVFSGFARHILLRHERWSAVRDRRWALVLLLLFGAVLLSQAPTQSRLPAAVERNDPTIATSQSMPDSIVSARHGLAVSPSSASVITQPFLALQNLWDTVWSIDATAAELNEANIMQAWSLREKAERGDLEATVLLLGAAGWCVAAGPLALQHDGVRGAPAACLSRFGPDIDSRDSLDWAIFRWTMQLSNAGFKEATLYASVLGRSLFFAPSSPVDKTRANAAAEPDVTETLRAQLIGQLQSMVAEGSADAASELHSYYLSAIAYDRTRNVAGLGGTSDSEMARHYAAITEQLDPTRSGMIELTETWIQQHL